MPGYHKKKSKPKKKKRAARKKGGSSLWIATNKFILEIQNLEI